MRTEEQASPLTRQELLDRFNFFRGCLLLGDHVIEPEHHQRVGIGQHPLIDRKPLSSLIDPLVDDDRLPSHLADNILESYCRQMEELKDAAYSLQEHLLRKFRCFV